MLWPVRKRWVTLLAGFIISLTAVSVAIGLTSSDGDDEAPPLSGTPSSPAPTTPAASASPTTPPATPRPTPSATAPSSPAPEQAGATGARSSGCDGVDVTATAAALHTFGDDAIDDTACAAVELLFTHRYSRLALPTRGYTVADFETLGQALTPSTWTNTYLPRVRRLVANPDNVAARRDLGLVLFRGTGTPAGAAHAAAGKGRVFYGPAFTTDGYAEGEVWINRRWSSVRASVDLTRTAPRLRIDLEASAALPVWNPAAKRGEMLTVPTAATLYYSLSNDTDGGRALVDSWRLTTGRYSYTPLVNR